MTGRWATVIALAGLAVVLPGCELPPVCDEDLGAGSPPGCVELNHPPQGGIVVLPAENDPVPIVGKKLNFVASAIDPDGDPLYVEWDFDSDGEIDQAHYADTEGLGDHIYHSPGRRKVTLRVSDFPGLPGGEGQFTDTVSVRVFTEDELDNDRSPIASFTASPNPALRNEAIRLDASASYDPDPDQQMTGFNWDITDFAGEPAGEASRASRWSTPASRVPASTPCGCEPPRKGRSGRRRSGRLCSRSRSSITPRPSPSSPRCRTRR